MTFQQRPRSASTSDAALADRPALLRARRERPPTRAAPEKPRPRPPGKRARTAAARRRRRGETRAPRDASRARVPHRCARPRGGGRARPRPRRTRSRGSPTTRERERRTRGSPTATCAHAGQPRTEVSVWRGTHPESSYVSSACDVNVRDPGAARWPLPPSRSMRARSPFGSTRPAATAHAAGELCERHTRVLRAPRGWRIEDRRHARELAAQELRVALDAHTPLLARAFLNAGAV